MTKPTIRQLRVRLEAACMSAAGVDPDGNEIEHCNHVVLEAAHELGAALNKRKTPRPMSQRAMRALGHKHFKGGRP